MKNYIQGEWKANLQAFEELNKIPTLEVYIPSDGEKLGEWIAKVRGNTKTEREANTKLIAAAPDLLECLIELVSLMEAIIEGEYTPDSFTCQPAKTAINKATS